MKKKIHLISNAHIDPVWQWEWQEGVGTAITTFSAAADFCEEFDNYVFCHNESILYEWVEKYDLPLFNRIQKLVKAGKWNIMGGWYLQPDCNMPTGESFIRHILRGNNYFESKFENYKKPTTAMNFDSFGHTKGLVQILNDAGYDSYIITRPGAKEDEVNMIWKGFNNSEVIVARVNDGYNSLLGQVDKKLIPFVKKPDTVPNELFLWGVGNHGGGPSRRDYKIIQEIEKENPHIEFIHSTPERYFEDVKKYKDKLKISGDLNHVNMGCYTSQIRIKQLHMKLENELFSAEKMAAHAALNGMSYPNDALKRAEEDLLFAQFHDILPGSDTKAAEDAALHQLGHGLEETAKVKLSSFFYLTKGEAKAVEGEYPVFAYNPHPYPVEAVIESEFMLADQNWSLTEFFDIEVFHNGVKIPSQLEKESSNLPLDWRKKVVFKALLKPFSVERFSCFAVSKPVVDRAYGNALEVKNDKLHARINSKTGLLDFLSIDNHTYIDKSIEFNIIENSCDPWGFFYDDYKTVLGKFEPMSKSEVQKFTDREDGEHIRVIENGVIRTVIQSFLKYNDSKMVIDYIIPHNDKDIRINITLLNSEKDIKLKMHIPTTIETKTYLGKTAFGINELDADGKEKVAQEYLVLRDQEHALGLINFGTYGSDSYDNAINQTLINSSAYCAHPIDDREILERIRYNDRIDIGERKFSFVITAGKTNEVLDSIEKKSLVLHQTPYVLNYFPTGSGNKIKPFMNIDNEKIQLIAFKKAEQDEGNIVRLFNSSLNKQQAHIHFNAFNLNLNVELNGFEFASFHIKGNKITRVNLLEKEIKG